MDVFLINIPTKLQEKQGINVIVCAFIYLCLIINYLYFLLRLFLI